MVAIVTTAVVVSPSPIGIAIPIIPGMVIAIAPVMVSIIPG
jgi:hypothetical protein